MTHEPIVIVGGGPAGAATALALNQRGLSCLVLEAASGAVAKIGETLPPHVGPLLHRLGADGCVNDAEHLPCYGNAFVWGNARVYEKDFLIRPHGHGWHIDRLRFEQQLCQLSRDRGVAWEFDSKVHPIAPAAGGGWRLDVQRHGETRAITAEFVVDASGRSARIAHRLGVARNRYDRLVALACPLNVPRGRQISQVTFVEAVEDGWWYAAPLSGSRLMLVFLTDSDLLEPSVTRQEFFGALQRTTLIRTLVPEQDAAAEVPRLVIRPVESGALRQACGENWLAVGDAAFAFDPISSYGITSALAGGLLAGNAIADHMAGNREALPAYRWAQEQEFLLYLEMLTNQYRLEARWPGHPFWARRHAEGFAEAPLE